MGVYKHNGPVNPAQVIAVTGAEGCTVREDGAVWTVEAHGVSDDHLAATVPGLAYDPDAGLPADLLNEKTLREKAEAALAVNASFLALQSPTNAQTVAQVKTLTKETSAVIRLLLGKLDSLDGT